MEQIQLPFLWKATMQDGSVVKQNPQDESALRPKTTLEDGTVVGGSSFTDIQDDVDNFNIVAFEIIRQNHSIWPHKEETWAVDLKTGLFMHNDDVFCVMPNEPLPTDNPQFKLIYFLNRRQEFNAEFDKKTGQLVKEPTFIRELPIQVCIGWQTNIEGKNYYSKILVE